MANQRRSQSSAKPTQQKFNGFENDKLTTKFGEDYYGQGRGQQMGQQMKQSQKLIQDQHFSNGTMMNVFSTMESLASSLNQQKPRRE
jgi:hypothetical protein